MLSILEYARILNVSNAEHNIRSPCKLLNSYSKQAYSKHCQTFKMECFAQRIIPECRSATRNLSGQGRFRGTRALR